MKPYTSAYQALSFETIGLDAT